MPESVELKHKDPSVGSFTVPVPAGQTPADVAAAWARSGWSPADDKPTPSPRPTPEPVLPVPPAEAPEPTEIKEI